MGILACTMPGGACGEIGLCEPYCNVARGVLIWMQVPYSSGGSLPGSPGPGDPTVLLRFRQVRSVDTQQQQLNIHCALSGRRHRSRSISEDTMRDVIVALSGPAVPKLSSSEDTMRTAIVPVEARRYPDPPYLWGQLCAKLAPSAAGSNQTAHTEGSMRGLTTNNRILGVLRGPLDFRTSESRRAFLRCGLSQWRYQDVDPTAIRVQMALSRTTVRELARRTGVSECTVWRWREHRPHVSPETAEKLTRALFQPAGRSDDPDKAA